MCLTRQTNNLWLTEGRIEEKITKDDNDNNDNVPSPENMWATYDWLWFYMDF